MSGRLTCWVYDLCLEAFPRQHRNTYRAEMVDAFAREAAERRMRSRWHAGVFVAGACLNAITAGFGERLRHFRFGLFMSRTDLALAWRMLIRYPGLSVIGIFGMAVGIAIAAGLFTVTGTMTDTSLPFADGERIVSLVQWDTSINNRERRMIHDFASWRTLSSLEDVSIARTFQRNLIVDGQTPAIVTVAEMSAAAFRVPRVTALRGRVLLAEDELRGAPDAIVISQSEWVRRFKADPDIVGKTLQLGATTYHIVGVMPQGFAFPLNHSYWIAWRVDPLLYTGRTGPAVNVFGRLAPGSTLASAQAELTALGERTAAAEAATHEHLRPRVVRMPTPTTTWTIRRTRWRSM